MELLICDAAGTGLSCVLERERCRREKRPSREAQEDKQSLVWCCILIDGALFSRLTLANAPMSYISRVG